MPASIPGTGLFAVSVTAPSGGSVTGRVEVAAELRAQAR